MFSLDRLDGLYEDIPSYRSAIVDECGDVVYWLDEVPKDKVHEILEAHEEWRISAVEC